MALRLSQESSSKLGYVGRSQHVPEGRERFASALKNRRPREKLQATDLADGWTSMLSAGIGLLCKQYYPSNRSSHLWTCPCGKQFIQHSTLTTEVSFCKHREMLRSIWLSKTRSIFAVCNECIDVTAEVTVHTVDVLRRFVWGDVTEIFVCCRSQKSGQSSKKPSPIDRQKQLNLELSPHQLVRSVSVLNQFPSFA